VLARHSFALITAQTRLCFFLSGRRDPPRCAIGRADTFADHFSHCCNIFLTLRPSHLLLRFSTENPFSLFFPHPVFFFLNRACLRLVFFLERWRISLSIYFFFLLGRAARQLFSIGSSCSSSALALYVHGALEFLTEGPQLFFFPPRPDERIPPSRRGEDFPDVRHEIHSGRSAFVSFP